MGWTCHQTNITRRAAGQSSNQPWSFLDSGKIMLRNGGFFTMPDLKRRRYSSTLPAIYSIGWFGIKNGQNLLGHFSVVGRHFRPNGWQQLVDLFRNSYSWGYIRCPLVIANNLLDQVVPGTRQVAYRNCWWVCATVADPLALPSNPARTVRASELTLQFFFSVDPVFC